MLTIILWPDHPRAGAESKRISDAHFWNLGNNQMQDEHLRHQEGVFLSDRYLVV